MQTTPDLHFGALAVRNGFASSSEIEIALETQKEGPPGGAVAPLKLGEILVERGSLTRAQINTLLETQTKLREAAAGPGTPVLFEEILPSTLTQEAGTPITVNDEPLTAVRKLRSGDIGPSIDISVVHRQAQVDHCADKHYAYDARHG